MGAPSDEEPSETPTAPFPIDKPPRPLSNVFDEDEASRMRYEDDPLTMEKRVAQAAFAAARHKAQADARARDGDALICEDEECAEDIIAAVAERVRVRPAMDSGATANVIHPNELPAGCHIEPNRTNRHFRGANNSRIERFGAVRTLLENEHGAVGCDWQAADVGRALHSVSTVCGPEEMEVGKQDVLFNNKLCVVMPPGIVAAILKRIQPVATYPRDGNLYVGEMTMSSFTRQGQIE